MKNQESMDIGKSKHMFVRGRYCSIGWRGLISKFYSFLKNADLEWYNLELHLFCLEKESRTCSSMRYLHKPQPLVKGNFMQPNNMKIKKVTLRKKGKMSFLQTQQIGMWIMCIQTGMLLMILMNRCGDSYQIQEY